MSGELDACRDDVYELSAREPSVRGREDEADADPIWGA
jgi:hypothetical protein